MSRKRGDAVWFETKENITKLKIQLSDGSEITLAEITKKNEDFILKLFIDKEKEYKTLHEAKYNAIQFTFFYARKLGDAFKWQEINSPYERCKFCGFPEPM